jgi:hypothetical protein
MDLSSLERAVNALEIALDSIEGLITISTVAGSKGSARAPTSDFASAISFSETSYYSFSAVWT